MKGSFLIGLSIRGPLQLTASRSSSLVALSSTNTLKPLGDFSCHFIIIPKSIRAGKFESRYRKFGSGLGNLCALLVDSL